MGPLEGIRVVEIASIGPGPFTAMMLADMGAEVLRVDRLGGGPALGPPPSADLLNRGRRSVRVDLKHAGGPETVLRLVEAADGLIEGFRPGVAERLGIGPDACLERNPRLVYGRMTGWGQVGPLASAAGHDINYIAVAGALHPIGRAGEGPVPPLNLVGDFGGGAMFLAFGMASALVERVRSGLGQVVDAAMVDGAAVLTTAFHSLRAAGMWSDSRGVNLLDGGAPFYDVYETSDGEHVAIGALEPQFFAELAERLGITDMPSQYDQTQWPEIRSRLAGALRSRTRAEWVDLLEGTDVCFGPVLSLGEAPSHPHNVARQTFVEVNGVTQPSPAPRFSRTAPAPPGLPPEPGGHTDEALADWGFNASEIAALRADRIVG